MTRKSCRIRTPTPKAKEVTMDSTNKAAHTDAVSRKRKSEPLHELLFQNQQTPAKKSKSMTNLAVEDDKIDPVEKLLCLTNLNNDILFDLETDESGSEPNSPRSLTASSSSVSTDASASSEFEDSPLHSPYPNMELDFSKVIKDNLRSYYLSAYKSPIEIHNDNSSFSILNKKSNQHASGADASLPSQTTKGREVPFFKNVNFNKPKFGNSIEDYLFYDDDESANSPTDLEQEEMPLSTTFMPQLPNVSFHYRRDDKLNLSLSDQNPWAEPQDISKILNLNSVMTGKSSEMVGTSRLLINDFFL